MDMICRIPEMVLEEGEYWVAIGAGASLDRPNGPQIGPYQAHLQLKNGNPETGNAIRLFMGNVMQWTDGGLPQGMPFDVFGSKEGVGVNVDELRADETKILAYPNPTSGIFELQAIENCKVIITDISGKIITASTINKGNHKFDLSSYQAGLYFIKLIGTEIHNLKVIKN